MCTKISKIKLIRKKKTRKTHLRNLNKVWLRKHKTRRVRIRELFEHRAVALMAVKLSYTPLSLPSSSPSKVETIRSLLALQSREISLSSSKLVRELSYRHKMLMKRSFSKMLIRK